MVAEDFTDLTFEERFAAQEKAYDLLWSNLSPWQRWTAVNFSVIPVIDSQGGKWLISPYGRVQNTYSWDEKAWYCCATEDPGIPIADSVLGTILLIKYNIEDFREIATPLSGRPDLSQQYDFVFQMVSTTPQGMNEQTCCYQGAGPKLEDLCDFHRGMEIGRSIGVSTGFHLYNEDSTLNRHLMEMLGAVSMVEELAHQHRQDDYNSILFGDTTYSTDTRGQYRAIAVMDRLMSIALEEASTDD